MKTVYFSRTQSSFSKRDVFTHENFVFGRSSIFSKRVEGQVYGELVPISAGSAAGKKARRERWAVCLEKRRNKATFVIESNDTKRTKQRELDPRVIIQMFYLHIYLSTFCPFCLLSFSLF